MVGLFSSPIDEAVGKKKAPARTKAVDKATSEYLPGAQEDIVANLEVCDMIKGKQVAPREAMRAIRRRLLHRNPNVQLLALKLSDASIKNTGNHFLVEVASREFVDTVGALARGQGNVNPEVQIRATEYLQQWALLFRSNEQTGYMYEVYEELRRSGHQFPPPPPHLDSFLVKTEAPPEWTDSDICMRCRTPFSLTNRKHHCRNCGRTFCQDCSAKTLSLPELGLLQEVRVCEGCFATKFAHRAASDKDEKAGAAKTEAPQVPGEEDELALALQLSLKESQEAERRRPVSRDADEETMLAAAIAASLQEARPVASPVASPVHEEARPAPEPLISSIERETVQLFSELMGRLAMTGQSVADAEYQRLAKEMRGLRGRLGQIIESGGAVVTSDLSRLLITLDDALAKYDHLAVGQATYQHARPSERMGSSGQMPLGFAPPIYANTPTVPPFYSLQPYPPYYPPPPPAVEYPPTQPPTNKSEADEPPLIEL